MSNPLNFGLTSCLVLVLKAATLAAKAGSMQACKGPRGLASFPNDSRGSARAPVQLAEEGPS